MGIDLLLEPQPAVDLVEMIHRRQEITLNDINTYFYVKYCLYQQHWSLLSIVAML